MNVSPEIVKAEMDYRIERALGEAARYRVRGADRAHRSWFRRSHEQREDPRPTAINGPPRVA